MEDILNQINPIVAVFTGIGGFIVAVLALFVALRSHRINVRALVTSKALEFPLLSLKLFGIDNCNDFIIAVPIKKKRVIELQLPVTIENTGKKTAEDINIYLRMNKELAYGGFVKKDESSTINQMSISGNFFSSISDEKSINPKMSKMQIYPVSLRTDTIVKGTFTTETLNKKAFNFQYNMIFSYEIHIVVSYRNNEPIGRRYKLRVLNTIDTPLKEIIAQYNKDYESEFRRLPFLQRFRRYINPYDSLGLRRIAVIIPKGDLESQGELPIDRLSINNLCVYNGLEDERGLFVPGLLKKEA